MKPDSMGLKP